MQPKISEAELRRRWEKKRTAITMMANSISKLRLATTRDLKSDNEKKVLTAICIKIMDVLGERVGNDDSANAGHYGCTDFLKSHVTINGNTVTVEYVGKSGIEHTKSFTDKNIAAALKKAIKNSPSEKIFVTSDGFEIPPSRINNFLSEFQVSAKDLRGYKVNKMVTDKLYDVSPEDMTTEYKRKRIFLSILGKVASTIGHTRGISRKHYLIPAIETEFIKNGKIVDLSDRFALGGTVVRNLLFRIIYGR